MSETELTKEALQARIEATDRAVRAWRRAYFRDNPPNTYLANIFNDLLRVLGTYETDRDKNAAREAKAVERMQ